MHYEIHRGYKQGRQLSPAQRKSGTFAEEPVVLGKVFRRGMKPMLLTEEQFSKFKAPLLRLLLSGSIDIFVVDGKKSPARLDYKTAQGYSPPAPAPQPEDSKPAVETASNGAGSPAPASAGTEEPEAKEPPSSGLEGSPEEEQKPKEE